MRRWWQPQAWWIWAGGALLLAIGLAQTPLLRSALTELLPDSGLRVAFLGMAAGLAYLFTAAAAQQVRLGRPGLMVVFGLGMLLRAAMYQPLPIPSPVVERYLWDGALTAHRINPYVHTPQDVARIGPARDSAQRMLTIVRTEAGTALDRMEKPWLRSWHPPLAQFVFAASYWLRPWSPVAWHAILALFDLATLALLIALFHRLRFPTSLLVIYWWNPLLIFETYCAGRLDLLPLPIVVAALLISLRGRALYAALLIALAGGLSLWPIALLPLVLIPLRRHPHALLAAAVASLALLAIAWLPLLGHGLGQASGLLDRWRDPQTHGGLYTLLLWLAQVLLPATDAMGWARVLAALLAIAWVLLMARGTTGDGVLVCDRALLAAGGCFLLSPWPLPWMALGLVPLLAASPRRSFLLLTPLLFGYYLRPSFVEAGQVVLFDRGLVWLQSVPVLLLLLWEGRAAYWRRTPWRPAPVADARRWEQGATFRWRSTRRTRASRPGSR